MSFSSSTSNRLPELALLLLGGDLDNSGLVDDAGGPLALLDDADDPGLVALLLLDVLKMSVKKVTRNQSQLSSRVFGF